MERINTANGLFTEGNPAQGIPATALRDFWFNGIQETIANAITKLGGVLDAEGNLDLANVLLTIQALASGNHYKGSVASLANLPTANNSVGDTYSVSDDEGNPGEVLTLNLFPANTVAGNALNDVLWEWTGAQWVKVFELPDLTGYLQKGGGAMTGALILASDPSQALQAATKEYVDGSFLLGDPGYEKLSNGWIKQRGSHIFTTVPHLDVITLPIAFPTKFVSVQVTRGLPADTGTNGCGGSLIAGNLGQFNIVTTATAGAGESYYWEAIGY